MPRSRRYLILLILMILFLSLFARLFYLQISSFDKFSEMAANQHNKVLTVEPRRGGIFDRFMEPMAINLDAMSVYGDPRNVSNKEDTARILSEILQVDHDRLLVKLKKNNAFVWIKRKVDDEAAKKVKALNLSGIHLMEESKRNYSNDSMAAHVIGFAGMDNKGLEGLELKYDGELKGEVGWRHLVRDAKLRTVLFDEEKSMPPHNGYNLVLTIDSVVQYMVEEELSSMVRKFHPAIASCVVIEPASGKVLAMANYPKYNLNDFSKTPREIMKNVAISTVYEPGSVFKIVTASAVLNEGIFSLDDPVYCEKGEYRTGGRILHDFHSYGNLSFRDVISRSSNIGTVKAAQKLGKQKLFDYISKFGFGKKTGIDLPGEAEGISRYPSKWSRSDITTIPIGQGIAVTPLQLACAVSVIANGGVWVKPYIVDRITTEDGIMYKKFLPGQQRRVLKEQTCEKMKEVLRRVITHGTGRRAKSRLYKMCGKTGTAQMVNPAGGYYPDKYNATFIGFAPMKKPVISIVVTAVDPHPVYFGGSVAGPTFKRIAERVLQYLRPEPENQQ